MKVFKPISEKETREMVYASAFGAVALDLSGLYALSKGVISTVLFVGMTIVLATVLGQVW